jgi:hypothetical protein
VGSARALIDGIGEAGLLESLSSCESVSLAPPPDAVSAGDSLR